MDPNAWIDPMYTTWAAIVANAATMVGRELFADEAGYLRYRLSYFNDAPSGTIPTKRILSVSQTLDSDEGIINRVAVRYGVQTETPFRERDAQLPSTYDEAHYHTRLLVIPAPWLENNADAQWYAEWALSWAAHDTRPAVVSVAFWPTVRIGQVLTLNYPPGQPPERYYVSSVVHDVTIPGPAVTVLGLTCGRPLDEVWTAIPAPSLIPTATVAGASGRTLPSGTGWTVTYYTLHDPGQAPLATGQDQSQNGATYVTSSSGARYYADGWLPPGASQQVNYGERRPCAFDPNYVIPELGCALSSGDIVRLADGTVLECEDTGGAVTGRHLDVFFWADVTKGDQVHVPASPQNLVYFNVANLDAYQYGKQAQQPTPAQTYPDNAKNGAAPGGSPLAGKLTITQGFGCTGYIAEPAKGNCPHFHYGVDLAEPQGTPIYATLSGTLTAGFNNPYQTYNSDPQGDYGYLITITVGPWIVKYAHCQPQLPPGITNGGTVGAGQQIGYVSDTGNATGPHLHYEIDLGGVDNPINPIPTIGGN